MMIPIRSLLATAAVAAALSPALAAEGDCPNGGTIRMGVEPFDTMARLMPIFGKVGDLLGKQLGCKVQVVVTTSYNAEIEAMRADRLELGEFGPLGYVLAHQVAHAEAVAAYGNAEGKPQTYTAGIVTWPGSGITKLPEVAGKTFAYSDPSSNSGHLEPAYALKQVGVDPNSGVRALYAGSHTASFETIRNHKVQAGELNSQEIVSATVAGEYKPGDYVELWRSSPLPLDPIAVRGDLPGPFKARLIAALQHLDLSSLPPDDLKILGAKGDGHLVPQTDRAYDGIRDLVKVLDIDLSKVNG